MTSKNFLKTLYIHALIILLFSLIFAWNLVQVGYQTDSEQLIYLHSEESLEPIHMNSNLTLTPIHMHSLLPFQEHINEPISTDWHELYPNYCTYWHLTSWNDTGEPYGELSPNDQIDMTDEYGNVTWFHVDRLPITINLSSYEYSETIFAEFKGPPEMLNESLYHPICTYWHEIDPESYSNVFHVINWSDNNNNTVVDYSDDIQLNMTRGTLPGYTAWYHVNYVSNDLILRRKMMNPISTWWHEIYPDYCKWHHLDSWEDTGLPFDQLSPNDQIDMIDAETGNRTCYHVDRMTVALNVTSELEPTEWMKIELETLFFEEMYEAFKHPNGTRWHEVYPSYCNVYSLTGWDWWEDDNCNGVLDACDYIWLLNCSEIEPVEKRYHVEDICYDLILNKKITDPVCTYWHELYPNFGDRYHVVGWEDNGDGLFTPLDQMNMTLQPGGPTEGYHIENMTLTLLVSNLTGPGSMYIEFEGYFEDMYDAKTKPSSSIWHEVYPEFSLLYELVGWDDNCNGILSFCDIIDLMNLDTGDVSQWHIEEVAIDIIVKEKVHDVAVLDVSSLYSWVYQGQVDPISVTVVNEGEYVESVDVYAFYDGNLSAPKQTVVLDPGQNDTLTFSWDTTGVPPGFYTVSANATIPVDDDPADNYFSDGTQEVRLMPRLYWKETYPDYVPSGVPDFDQRQDQWDNPPGSSVWTWCAPTAVANSLWWYDSKYEPNLIWPPPAKVDNYPLVTSYNPGVWDDHDPQNVQPFIQHLAYLMDADGQRTGINHVGTWVWDMQAGIAQYLSWTGVNPLGDVNGDGRVNQTDVDVITAAMGSTPVNSTWNTAADIWPVTIGWPGWGPSDNIIDAQDLSLVTVNIGERGMFYEHTVQAPDFFYIEEEVERSEDVILVLGFWNYDADAQIWVREEYPYPYGSGHCITAAGVNSTSMQIAVSDPIQDNAEPPPHGTSGPGRVIPTPPHLHPQAPPDTVHNNASKLSQDIYNITSVPCPSGNWTLINYSSPQYLGWNVTVIEWSITVSPLSMEVHDVAVLDVSSLYSWVYEGQVDPINVTVANQGNYTETIDVFAFYNGSTAAPKQTVVLDPGQNETLTFNWDTTGVFPGFYTVSANATIPVDDDPADNYLVGNQQEVRELVEVHDVAVLDVKASKTVIGQGYSMNISVTVENKGDYAETFNVTVYYNATYLNTTEITLVGGDNATVIFNWNTTGVAKGNYAISAYAHPVLGETGISDNNFTDGLVSVAMLGDLTGIEGIPDGKVDMRDVSLVAKAFGANLVTDPASPKYGEYWHSTSCDMCPHSPNCDMTGPTSGVTDGKIEMRDVSLVASNFGRIDP